jgi:enterochelin esterase family protein
VYRLDVSSADDHSTRYTLTLDGLTSIDDRLKPAPAKEKYVSPRLEELRKQFAGGNRITEDFWAEISKKGTPLVEESGDAKYQLVTFLWRGTESTRSVLVAGSFNLAGRKPIDNQMQRLAGTDVWYLTLRMPAGARFYYTLSVNDPTGTQRMAAGQADPLNPKRWLCAPEAAKFECLSPVELPGAWPQPWIVKNPGTPAGTVDKHKIKSELLGNERDLSIYTPPGYQKGRAAAYPLLVVFDESAYLAQVPTPVILDNLIAASKIPETVAVLIANPTPMSRNKELPPNPVFADFLAKELLPFVTSNPKLTVVAGSSYGGIASVYAGLRHPEVFGKILCQSGSFWWAPDHPYGTDVSTETGWLAKEYIKSPKLALDFYMDAGSFEIDQEGGGGAILEPSRQMRDVLLAKGYAVKYQQFIGGHDYLSWRGTLADGLIALIGK